MIYTFLKICTAVALLLSESGPAEGRVTAAGRPGTPCAFPFTLLYSTLQ